MALAIRGAKAIDLPFTIHCFLLLPYSAVKTGRPHFIFAGYYTGLSGKIVVEPLGVEPRSKQIRNKSTSEISLWVTRDSNPTSVAVLFLLITTTRALNYTTRPISSLSQCHADYFSADFSLCTVARPSAMVY